MREEYVKGDDSVTTRSVGAAHKCPFETVGRWASKEDWVGQRAAYRQQIVSKGRERATTDEAEILARQLKAGRFLQDIALHELQSRLMEAGKRLKGLPVSELRKMIVSGSDIERKAAGISDEVRLKVESELRQALDDLSEALSPDQFQAVVNVLARRAS